MRPRSFPSQTALVFLAVTLTSRSLAAAVCGRAGGTKFLDGWARHVPEGAVNTAVPGERAQNHAAAFAVVKELTSVCRHRVGRTMATRRARQGRGELHQDTHFRSVGSRVLQMLASTTRTVAAIKRASERGFRPGTAQALSGPQTAFRLCHQNAQAAIRTAALTIRSGVRMPARTTNPAIRLAPTPTEASANGSTQHAAAAVTAPNPKAAASDARLPGRRLVCPASPTDGKFSMAISLTGLP